MLCGSIKDFDLILSKINYLEKKMYTLQKDIKSLLETITQNQEEIKMYLTKPMSPTFIEKDSADYCSIKL